MNKRIQTKVPIRIAVDVRPLQRILAVPSGQPTAYVKSAGDFKKGSSRCSILDSIIILGQLKSIIDGPRAIDLRPRDTGESANTTLMLVHMFEEDLVVDLRRAIFFFFLLILLLFVLTRPAGCLPERTNV